MQLYKKWVSDLRAGLRKRNKQKTCDFELSFGKRDQSTAEVKEKIVRSAEVQPRQVS
jgi:hypothetical protein